MNQAAATIKEWRENPVKFVYDNFKVDPDIWQKETLEKLKPNNSQRKRIGMRACTGPGKSACLAWAGWYRLSCFGGLHEHPKGAALSGEGKDNLSDNLWAELSTWQQRSDFLKEAFVWNKEQIHAKDHRETWFLSARSYPKDADLESIGRSLSGLHSPYPFILLDEIGDMPITIGQKAEQIFTGGAIDGLIMGAGNPTSTSGLLYAICSDITWDVITITADPDDPKRTPRVDIEHAREQIKKYGRDNPWVMATILGLFPSVGFNTLLSLQEVEAAMNRHLSEDKYDWAQKRLGVDCARFGDDATVIFPRQGLAAFKLVEMMGARSDEISARVAAAKAKWNSEMEFVDGTGGFGSGVIDNLITAGYSPQEIHFSGKATDAKYYNKRAEMWFEMAEWVKRGGSLPEDTKLKRELTTPKYTFKNGKFILEDKDQIKKRLGFSPDRADALALTFAMVDMPKQDSLLKRMIPNHTNHASEYEPSYD